MGDIAIPRLQPITDVSASVGPPIDVGATPHGVRRIVPILAGEVSGPRLNGRLVPGGADFQCWRSDGVTEIHARYVIETTSGARIYVENTGLRHGPREAMARLERGEAVDPSEIYFRTVPKFETADPELVWLMRGIFLCSGARFPDRVLLRFYEVT